MSLPPLHSFGKHTETVGSTGYWEYDGEQEHTGPTLRVSGGAGVEWIEKYVSNKPRKLGSRAWLLWSQVLTTSGLSRPSMQTSLPSPGTGSWLTPDCWKRRGINPARLFLTKHGTFLMGPDARLLFSFSVCGPRNDCNAITQSLVIGTDQEQHLGREALRCQTIAETPTVVRSCPSGSRYSRSFAPGLNSSRAKPSL